MKNLKSMWVFLTTLLVCTLLINVAFAQEAVVSTSELLKQLLEMAKGLKGASTLAIVGALIQAFLLFSKSAWSKVLGKWKLIIVALLSFIGLFIAGKIQGLDFMTILTDTATLTAFQVLISQGFKQIKKND